MTTDKDRIAELQSERDHIERIAGDLQETCDSQAVKLAELQGLLLLQADALNAIADPNSNSTLITNSECNNTQDLYEEIASNAISATSSAVAAARDELTAPLRSEVTELRHALRNIMDSSAGEALTATSSQTDDQAPAESDIDQATRLNG